MVVRIRPDEEDLEKCVNVDENTVRVSKREQNAISGRDMVKEHSFKFDTVYGPSSTQVEVFEQVKPMLDEAVDGYTATVFAFGMTGSGKTHTISGTETAPGLVPRSIEHVFERLHTQTSTNSAQVAMVSLTYVELYNNALYDLLDPTCKHIDSQSQSANGHRLRILDDPTRGVHIVGSPGIRTPVSSPQEAMELIRKGNKLRSTSTTKLNERSSRSHTVISLEVLSRSLDSATGAGSSGGTGSSEPETTLGKINLVDLAGSERVKLSGAEGQTLEEAKQINKALSVLGDVLNSLSKYHEERDRVGKRRAAEGVAAAGVAASAAEGCEESSGGEQDQDQEGSDGSSSSGVGGDEVVPMEPVVDVTAGGTADPLPPHIPFRNSKLTMLLKDSLGGRSRTMMVATIRSQAAFYSQSMTALRYAARARHIRNVPIKNSDASDTGGEGGVGGAKIKHTLAEVSRLRAQLDQRTEDFQRLCGELAVLQQAQARSSEPSTPGDSQREERYKAKISEMAEQTENEKRELQEHTRCLIHGHESALAEREREFESVQSKMRRSYEKQLASLQEDHKSNLIYRKETEFNQQELTAELEQAQSDIGKLKSALRETLKTHKQGKEEWATKKEEWGKEKGQFVAALQRVSAARARTKAQIGDLVEENEGLRAAALAWQEGLRAVDVARQQDGEQPEVKAGVGFSSSSGNRMDKENLQSPALSVDVDVDECEDVGGSGSGSGSGSGGADASSLDSSHMTSPVGMGMGVDATDVVGAASPGVSSDGGSSPGTPKTRAIRGMKDKIRGMAENEGDMVSQMEQRLGDLEDARVKLQRLQATWNSEYSSLSAAQIQGESEVDTLRHTLFKAENRIGSLEAELASERARVHQLEKQGVGPVQGVSATTSKVLKSRDAKELVAMLGAIKAKDAAAVRRSNKN